MRFYALASVALILVVGLSTFAQDTETQKPQCFEPLAQTFDEFVLTTPQDLSARAKQFEDKVGENPESQGIVFIYAGKRSKLNEVADLSAKISKALKGSGTSYGSRIWIQDGGYRAESTIVFVLRPLKCTEYPAPSPDITADQVEFTDVPGSGTVRMSGTDLYAAQVYEPTAECPPAARAVRACDGAESEVFIIVDGDGAVIFSKAMSGHPLIRAAAAATAKKWYFKPYKDKSGKPASRSGVIVVKFPPAPPDSDNN